MKNAIAIISCLIAIAAAYVAIDQRYAHAAEVQKLEQRLEMKILEDRSQAIQERIWRYEDRAERNKKECPPELIDSIRRLQSEKQQVDDRLKATLKK